MVYVVVISVDFINAREVCEQIENSNFSSLDSLRAELNSVLEVDEEADYFACTLSVFMDKINDDLINITENFITYVNIEQ